MLVDSKSVVPTQNTEYACNLAAIRDAATRLKTLIHRTPVMTSESFDRLAGRRIYFKCENLQKVGAFKYRGATNAVLMLTDAQAARGVVTHSSASAWAWLPLECVTTPRAAWASVSFKTALVAPRYLNAPTFWRFSHLK